MSNRDDGKSIAVNRSAESFRMLQGSVRPAEKYIPELLPEASACVGFSRSAGYSGQRVLIGLSIEWKWYSGSSPSGESLFYVKEVYPMKSEEIRFAHRFDQVSGSAIREIFKVIAQPGMISFAGGNPSPNALPDELVS